MAKYLAPTSDVVFKKIFGHHPHLMKSFLNALLPLEDGREIVEIEYLPPELVPEIPEFKRTIADVLCKDQEGRHFIVEMQIAWVANFKPRLLHETTKTFSRQLKSGENYDLLQPVYGLGLIGQSFDPNPDQWYHHFKLTDIKKSPHESMDYLHLIFVELPKVPISFSPMNSREVKKLGILWLRFMREINEDTKQVPAELLEIQEISEAVKLSEEIAYSPSELRYYESYWDELRRTNALVQAGEQRGEKRGLEKGIEQGIQKGIEQGIEKGIRKGIEQGIEEGIEKGLAQGLLQVAEKMLKQSKPVQEIMDMTGLSELEIKNLV